MTILKFKWYKFYQNLFDDKYRQDLKDIFGDENKLREELKEKKEAKEKEETQDKRLDLVDFISKPEIREAIKKIIDMDYKQLLEYRRVGMIMPQKISESATSREKLIELLRAEKVSEFNALRDREGLEEIDLSRANFSGANLSRADLSWAVLGRTNLNGADLNGANLSMANLRWAIFSGADLNGANLNGADLNETDFSGANLSRSDLRWANLGEADLSGANLNRANLSDAIIIVKEQNYQEASVSGANFEDALINDSGFLEYLRENRAKNVPDDVSTKDEFINEMKKRGLDLGSIEQFFDEY